MQKNAFLVSQEMPKAPSLHLAATEYQETVVSADANLRKAYETAISSYTKAQRFDDAERVKKMKLERFPAGVPADTRSAPPTDPILEKVRESKREFVKTIQDANAGVLASINARATAEADRGNLDAYKYYSALYIKVKSEILVPEEVKDIEIRNAGVKFLTVAEAAAEKLRRSYNTAVSDLTKARRIEEAEVVRAELGDGGWFRAYTGKDEGSSTKTLARIRFAEQMGYTVGVLVKGARSHNNDGVTYDNIPAMLGGKSYTLCVAKANGHVRIRFLTSGKVYVLLSSWAGKRDVAELSRVAQRETDISPLTTSGAETFEIWSISAKAGIEIDLASPFPVVAESLEKSRL